MRVLTENSSPKSVAANLKASANLDLPDGWWNWPNVIEAHKRLSRAFLRDLPEYPQARFDGRGVVICAGGGRLFTNGWVCLRMLRHAGCALPVEFWHLPDEIDPCMAALVAPHGAECVDAGAVAARLARRPRILRGWELKAFALLQSRFREVLLLDADNVPLVAPEFLFDTDPYRKLGSVFWPDYGRMEESRLMWSAAEVPYRDEPEIESGQIVLDKARCWPALNLAMHYNEHSDFYYKHIHGDKCTFQFAWHRLAMEYAMPPHGIHSLHCTMCQHDFDGRRIFQHRNMDKWRLDGSNVRVHDFRLEDVCRAFLRDLATRWNGKPFGRHGTGPGVAELVRALVGARCDYHRLGHDRRQMVFLPHGAIGEGADECERGWSIHLVGGRHRLTLVGDEGVTCHLDLDDDGVFRGRRSHHERMQVELIPCDASVLATASLGSREEPSASESIRHDAIPLAGQAS